MSVGCRRRTQSADPGDTRGVPLRGPSGNRPRVRSNTSGCWREEALLDIEGGDLAAGCWRIVDRKCRSSGSH
jgi:hypothetical protein